MPRETENLTRETLTPLQRRTATLRYMHIDETTARRTLEVTVTAMDMITSLGTQAAELQDTAVLLATTRTAPARNRAATLAAHPPAPSLPHLTSMDSRPVHFPRRCRALIPGTRLAPAAG